MTNEQTFDIYLVKTKTFDIYLNKTKTFDIYLNKTKTFDISIYKINMINRYVVSFISKFVTTTNSSLLVNGTTNMSMGKFNITVNPRDLRNSVPYFINHLPIVIKEKMLMEVSITNPVTFNTTVNGKVKMNTSTMVHSSVGMTCTPHVRGFYTLADHDTKTLAEMDAMTLAELDYYDL